MRTASSILCWIGGLLDIVLGFLMLPPLGGIPYYTLETVGRVQRWVLNYYRLPPYFWSIYLGYAVLCLILLFWRQYSLASGKKKLCGILSLIFISPIGGILTLCIPNYDLG